MAGPVGNSFRSRVSGHGVLRYFLALILLVAATLKTHQLATTPVLGDGLLDSRWVFIATVEFELFFGLWLAAGLFPRTTWAAALGCFGLFACVSLYKAANGATSCGCFGRVEVNPWHTFTLDALAVLALVRWQPGKPSRFAWGRNAAVPRGAALPSARALGVMTLWLAVGVPAAVAMGTYQPAMLSADGVIQGNDNLVILEPEKWIGRRCPLLPFIETSSGRSIGQQLANGRWIIVLHHRDCPECRRLLAAWRQGNHGAINLKAGTRIAVIEVPLPEKESITPFAAGGQKDWLIGKLSDSRDWFVETPVALLLDEGITVHFFKGEFQ